MVPKRIRVSGLPLTLCGWNTELVYNEESGCYILYPYIMWGIFAIHGAKIMKRQDTGQWAFFAMDRFDGGYSHTHIYKLGEDTTTPIGEWTYGARIAEV